MSVAPTFDGAVLCGGDSRRMGRDKALVEVGGEPMAARVAAALRTAGAERVTAVGGDGDALRSVGLDFAADRWPGEGPLGGLISALGTAGSGSIVAVVSCDLLRPDPAELARLVALVDSSEADAVIPLVDGRPQWLHGVWRRRVSAILEDVFASGERSLFGAVGGIEVDFVDGSRRSVYADADLPSDLPESL